MNKVNKHSNKNIFLLVSSGTLSYLGDLLYIMALNIWVARVTNSPEALGLLMSVGSFALFAGNPIGGILADKYNKKALLVITDIISALSVLITYFVYTENSVNLLPILICNVILSFCFSIYSPTARAIAPFVAKGNGLRKLNSLLTITGEVIKLLSPAIGGFLLAFNFLNERSLILINSFSFVISGVLNYYLIIHSPDHVERKTTLLDDLKSLFSGYKEIWFKMEEIRTILIPISLLNFFAGGLHVLLPFLDLSKDKTDYPNFLLAEAAGAVFGGLISGKLKSDFNWKQSQIILIGSGLSIIGLNNYLPQVTFYPMLFVFGFSIALFNINFFTVVQKHTDEKYIGRTFGLIFTVISALTPVGNLVFSKLESSIPGNGITITGIGMICSIALAMMLTNLKD